MAYDEIIRQHARLIMLRVLAAQPNYSLNDSVMSEHLEMFGIAQHRDWVRDQMTWLAGMGAVKLTEVGKVRVATLTDKGREHVERRLVIEGIKRMGPQE